MFYILTTKPHFHSSKLVQDRISKIRNLLPNVPNLIKFGGIAHHNQQHEKLKYYLSAAIPFKGNLQVVSEGCCKAFEESLDFGDPNEKENRVLCNRPKVNAA